MSGVAVALACLLQTAPTALEVEKATNPAAVQDNTPDFSAVHGSANTLNASRYFIQVSTNAAFSPITHWNVTAANGINFTDIAPNVRNSPEFPYGNVGPAQAQAAPRLSWNTLYHWRIAYRLTNNTNTPFSAAQFTMASPASTFSANGNGGPSGLSWRFTGMPIASASAQAAGSPVTTVPGSELFDDVPYVPALPYAYRWDEPTGAWIVQDPSVPLQGGRGYLVATNPGDPVDLAQGTVASGRHWIHLTFTAAAPALYRGNCLLANPYNAPLDWRAPNRTGQVTKTNVSTTYYKWDGSQYLTYNAANMGSGVVGGAAGPTLAPFQGFFAVATSANNPRLLLTEPPRPAGDPGGVQRGTGSRLAAGGTPDPNNWVVELHAASAGAVDTENFAGVLFDSLDGEDESDAPDLGSQNTTYVTVAFDHFDWVANPRSYTHDLRRPRYDVGDELSWDLTVSGNTGAPVTITWPKFADLPTAEWEFRLHDPATSTDYDLATTPSFVTPALGGPNVPLTLKATRLTEFRGSLQIAAAAVPAAPPTDVAGGTLGVPLLAVDLTAVGEPVTVTSFTATHTGAGDPAKVQASLLRDGVVIAGPSAFTGGQVVWALAETVDHTAPQTWTIAYDFAADATGTHGASTEAADAVALGFYTTKSVAAPAAVLSGPAVNASPASSAGGGSCGLLGAEAALLLLGIAKLRRRIRPAANAA